MKLVNVYSMTLRVAILYEYLRDRLKEPGTNISHTKLPSFEDHKKFVESKPYAGWYFIESGQGLIVGVCYMTRQYELGVYICHNHRRQGWAAWALHQLMEMHPADQYLAHINPQNEASKIAFKRLGFGLLQETYSLRSDHDRNQRPFENI